VSIMKTLLRLNLSLVTLLISACVTINVYFPAGAAEKAADEIIDSVIKGAGKAAPRSSTPAPRTTPPQSSVRHQTDTHWLVQLAGRTLHALVPAAHAQGVDANMDVSSPEIRAITASMQERFDQLERFFDAGVIGLTTSGLIEIRDANAAALPDRALVRRLVAEDNNDRNALYEAIARANDRPEWEADIRRIFAQRWIERGARPGWYYQDGDGNWQQR
ncbi:MAG: YdbL family protein, partial [Xanthomonadales bacterium]|nr:YdbL family protein [Xanthomonadales bacterium]